MLTEIRPKSRTERCDGRSRRLVIVANRAPIVHHLEEGGSVSACRAAGGVATALAAMARKQDLTWVAAPSSPGDRWLAWRRKEVALDGASSLRFVEIPAERYRLFYESFANPVLWFVQHGLGADLGFDETRRAWEEGYLPTNQAFAEAVIGLLRRQDGAGPVMLHDYHLYLAPLFIRNACPGAVLQHFVHIPWPLPHEWARLPEDIVASICEGLLANDSVVFQTPASAENFLVTVQSYFGDQALVDMGAGAVVHHGRRTRVWANPISVDPGVLEQALGSPEAQAHRRALLPLLGEKTIVRVDRMDPAKNIALGFKAFDSLLTRHPEWKQRVRMLAFLVPSRSHVREYQEYEREVLGLVAGINARHRTAGWTPISVFYEHNIPQAYAALSLYDVLLVNSRADGMNLVAKEGVVLNQRDGVLALSVNAGAYEELRHAAVSLVPPSIISTTEALHRALSMPLSERRERAQSLKETVRRWTIGDWLQGQMDDLFARQEWRVFVGAGSP